MKALGIIIVIAVVAGAVWWVASKQSDEVTETVTEENEATNDETDNGVTEPQSIVVTYTDAGFSPSTVTINPGDSVVFKNESSRPFQPASDPHPVHTDLSGFDADTSVAPGQSYTFTFNKSGTWGFHNHLNSDKTGTVIVR